MGPNPTQATEASMFAERRIDCGADGIPNEEIGDFAVGQEQTHHDQGPHRFSEGEETLPEEKDNGVGDFAEGQEIEHKHHTGTFAEGRTSK
jgi:hypothetical protein